MEQIIMKPEGWEEARQMCVRHNLCTQMTCEEYYALLNNWQEATFSYNKILDLAKQIVAASNDVNEWEVIRYIMHETINWEVAQV